MALLDRMCRVIRHRGPDDQGMAVQDEASLGMRRLAIIDLEGGRQPIYSEDRRLIVVLNGEIYNYRDLRRRLESRGHHFYTCSDTETIVHAYEESGAACVNELRGMFALAIWDGRRKRLVVARDRVGKKPLYYTLTHRGTFVFGSELKSLLEHPEVKREIDPRALDAYLTLGYIPDPLSIFRNIRKLPPGHTLTFAGGRLALNQYWDFCFEPAEPQREEELLEQLRWLLNEAVRVRLVSDVPVGAFLSGGIDSTAVVGLMARHGAQPLKTFSIGFGEQSHDEIFYARIAAKRFGTEHHELVVTPDLCRIVDELVWHLDEPFADLSAIPTYLVSRLARETVTVALSGDGGDELFAGYTRYQVEQQRTGFDRLPRLLRHGMIRPISRLLPHGVRGRNYMYNIGLDPLDRYLDSISVFTALNRPLLYTDGLRDQIGRENGGARILLPDASRVTTGEALDRLLYIDSKVYLPGDILTKVDRMSMAVSLEVRSPLLDQHLIDFVTRLPASLKLRGAESKRLLRRAVADLVPQEILTRPKQGFDAPMQTWLNQPLRQRLRDTLLDARTASRGYFQSSYVRLLMDEHERGRRDHSLALWSLFMLELWHRTFIDRPAGTLLQAA